MASVSAVSTKPAAMPTKCTVCEEPIPAARRIRYGARTRTCSSSCALEHQRALKRASARRLYHRHKEVADAPEAPRLARIKGGWAAYGDSWAVHGHSKDVALERFWQAVVQRKEIGQRPPKEPAEWSPEWWHSRA